MIRPPHRSVTRFFVPLLDVLILLFCIFLLMPYVKPSEGEGDAARIGEPAPEPTPGSAADLAKTLETVKAERDRLAKERGKMLQELVVRPLEIDRETGRLYDYDPERIEIANEADALLLIDRIRRKASGREVYFLLLFPREAGGFPLQRQVSAYEKWFRGVPHGFDSPSGRP